jgi:hypothetical protein
VEHAGHAGDAGEVEQAVKGEFGGGKAEGDMTALVPLPHRDV